MSEEDESISRTEFSTSETSTSEFFPTTSEESSNSNSLESVKRYYSNNEGKSNNSTQHNSRKKYKVILCSLVCVVVIFFSLIFLGVAVVLFIKSSDLDSENEETVTNFLWINLESKELSSIESTKEINDFAFYSAEHGVDIFEILKSDAFEEEGDFTQGGTEYICTCDLKGLKVELSDLEDDFSRRSLTEVVTGQSTRRSSAVAITGIVTLALGLLISYFGSRVVLTIYADSDEEAVEIAADKVTTRITSEVLQSKDAPRDTTNNRNNGRTSRPRGRRKPRDAKQTEIEELRSRVERMEDKIRVLARKSMGCRQRSYFVERVSCTARCPDGIQVNCWAFSGHGIAKFDNIPRVSAYDALARVCMEKNYSPRIRDFFCTTEGDEFLPQPRKITNWKEYRKFRDQIFADYCFSQGQLSCYRKTGEIDMRQRDLRENAQKEKSKEKNKQKSQKT